MGTGASTIEYVSVTKFLLITLATFQDYVVLTSVDRDDVADAGSSHIAETIRQIKLAKPEMMVECLSPDFAGDLECVDRVANSGLDVFAHNIETVERLTPFVRDARAKYRQG